MFLRYRGGGIGHLTTRAATNFFKQDRHPSDLHGRPSPQDSYSDAMVVDIAEDAERQASDVEDSRTSSGSDEEVTTESEEEENGNSSTDLADEPEGSGSDSEDGEDDEVEQLGFGEF
jgi:hypothetical protein